MIKNQFILFQRFNFIFEILYTCFKFLRQSFPINDHFWQRQLLWAIIYTILLQSSSLCYFFTLIVKFRVFFCIQFFLIFFLRTLRLKRLAFFSSLTLELTGQLGQQCWPNNDLVGESIEHSLNFNILICCPIHQNVPYVVTKENR